MADVELVGMDTESATAKVEQLGKTFAELESRRKSSLHGKTQWEDVREYFQNLDKSLKEKYDELEEKEMAYKQKKSETQIFLAEREAAVGVKECASLDRLQELKDVAVSAIAEARKRCKVDFQAPASLGGSKENKVSTIANGNENAPITAPEEKFPGNKSGESADAVAVKDMPRPQLKQLCEQMDAKGVLKFISENRKNHMSLRKDLSMALKSAPEPARLVLESLEDFYPLDQPTSQGDKKDPDLQALRRNCLVLMECITPLFAITEPDGNTPVNSEIKQQAKAIADQWKPKLADMDLDASNGISSEAHAFLQLLVTFGIASNFDEDELCKLVLAVSRCKQAPELCRSLGLAHKAPGVVEALVNSGRQIDAVHFVYTFELSESFPAAPLLKGFLNDLGKSVPETTAHTEAAGAQDASSQELSALRAVVRFIEEYKLQEEYPLGPLQTRVAQLKKERAAKGLPDITAAKVHAKRARFNPGRVQNKPDGGVDARKYPHTVFDQNKPAGGVDTRKYPHTVFDQNKPAGVVDARKYAHTVFDQNKPAGGVDAREYPHTVFDDRALYGGIPERYPYAAPAYEAPAHSSIGQLVNVQRAYHYPAERVHPPPSYNTSSYGSFMGSESQHASANYGSYLPSDLQPASANYGSYMASDLQSASVNQEKYTSSVYHPAQSNPGSYAGTGLQSSHQSYM